MITRFLFVLVVFSHVVQAQYHKVDTTFNTTAGFNGDISLLKELPSGNWLVYGEFTEFDGQPVPELVKLDKDFNQLLPFNYTSGLDTTVADIEVVDDNTILIGGYLDYYNGQDIPSVIMIDSMGTLKDTLEFNYRGSRVREIERFSNGNFLVRLALNYDGHSVVRFFSDGRMDSSLTNQIQFTGVDDIVITPSDQILITGYSLKIVDSIGYKNTFLINYDGTIDDNYNVRLGLGNLLTGDDFIGIFTSMTIKNIEFVNNQFHAFGRFNFYDYTRTDTVAIFNLDGSLDSNRTFAAHASLFPMPYGVMELDSNVLVYNGLMSEGVRFFDKSGQVLSDSYFGNGANRGLIKELFRDEDDNLVGFGNFTTFDTTSVNRVVRLLPYDYVPVNPPTLAFSYITIGPPKCAGASVLGRVVISGDYGVDNEFILECSDSSGKFENSIIVQEYTAQNLPQNYSNFPLPEDVPTGANYALRIRSTNPELISQLGNLPLTINNPKSDIVQIDDETLSASVDGLDYQWKYCDSVNVISGAAYQDVDIDTSLSYQLITALNGCVDTTNCYTIFQEEEFVSSIENTSDKELVFYPNPATSKVYFYENIEFVKVFDVYGNTVLNRSHVSDIDISRFSKGAYFVHIRQNEETLIEKLVIE